MSHDDCRQRGPAGLETRSHYWFAAGLILLLGALLRFYRLGSQIVLDDEWHALNVVQNTDYRFIFSHLGHADHSIPLALLYEWFSHTIGLDEFTMRLPSLLAGTALIVAFPLLMRPWLCRSERLIATALLAISPFLVNFSRVARPYALLALLTACSLPLAWRWWHSRRRGFGLGWYACAVLAAWLSPVSLATTAAPFLWFGTVALGAAFADRNWQPLRRLLYMGVAMLVSIAALLAAPLETDLVSLTIKSGMDHVNIGTWIVLLGLFSGSGADAVVIAMAAAALLGLLLLYRRAGSFGAYLACTAVAAGIAVSLTGAQWIYYGLVPARYLCGLLPVYLALVAISIATLAARLQGVLKWPPIAAHGSTIMLLLALLLGGPLPSWNLPGNQFVAHLAYQFDYKTARNPIRRAHESVEVEPFYAEIARQHPQGDAVIVEAPWYLESNFNPLYLSQAVHGQRVMIGFVGGLCAGPLYGELKRGAEGLEFRNFIYLTDLLEGRARADYLVLRRTGIDGARKIDMDFGQCERAVRARLGPPWRETKSALVFRLTGGAD
jgi:uncharacterized membrane protein